jgi:CheY-like chemotaxis protein
LFTRHLIVTCLYDFRRYEEIVMHLQTQLAPAGSTCQEPFANDFHLLQTVVIDDSPDFLEVICALLDLDYNVDIVARGKDGADAIELVAKLRPDLLLMDIDMPRLDGLQAARVISELFPGTQVVLMSASPAPELRSRALASGADGFVSKTRFREEFSLVVEQWAAR